MKAFQVFRLRSDVWGKSLLGFLVIIPVCRFTGRGAARCVTAWRSDGTGMRSRGPLLAYYCVAKVLTPTGQQQGRTAVGCIATVVVSGCSQGRQKLEEFVPVLNFNFALKALRTREILLASMPVYAFQKPKPTPSRNPNPNPCDGVLGFSDI